MLAATSGEGRAAKISSLADVEVLPSGRLLVTERGSNRIRAFDDVFPEPPSTPSQVILIPSEDGRTRYVFDSYGKHLRTEDAQTDQVLLTFGYDSLGYATSITDAFSNSTTIERNAGHVATAIVAPFGQRTELTYDGNGYLATVENPESEQVQFTYDADGLMQTMTDARSHVVEFTFDAKGRLERDEDPLGGFTALSRDNGGSTYTITKSSAMGRTTTILTEKLPTGETRTTTTAPDGTTSVALKSPSGARTSTSADGTVATAMEVPDPRFGMQAPLASQFNLVAPGGHSSATSSNRVVHLVDPAADPADPANVSSVVDTVQVNGRTTTSTYNAASRQLTVLSPEGRQSTATTDFFGRLTTSQVGNLTATGRSYDARGRLSQVTQGSRATTFAYGSDGFVASVTDSLNRTTSYGHDSIGRVTSQVLPDGRAVGFAYDANGNLTSITPPARPAHGFQYDDDDQGTHYSPPDLGSGIATTRLFYNLDHQVIELRRPDTLSILNSYDPVTGRLTSSATPRGTYSYSYDSSTGNLLGVSAPGGAGLTYAYEGSLLSSMTWSGEVTGALQFTYDNDFRLVSQQVNGAQSVAFAYDNDGLLTGAGDLSIDRQAATGFISAMTLGALTDHWTYNGFGELAAFSADAGSSPLLSQNFTRDAGGRVEQKVEVVEGTSATLDYEYDTAGRLREVRKNNVVVESYSYDANSNRTAWTDPWGSGTATYDNQDRLLTYGPSSYTYTVNGELLTKVNGTDTTTYAYDITGALLGVTLPTGIEISYVIDPSQRRIGKRVNGTLVKGWLYQNGTSPIAELDGSGAVVSRFVYGTSATVPEYFERGGQKYRIWTDPVGSVRLVVKVSDGSIAQRIDYDAFGRIQLDTNPGFQPFGYGGGLYDDQTGLTRFGARDYDAETGRWTTKDPIGFAGGDTNLYGYVLNDPVNLSDPNGTSFKSGAIGFFKGLIVGAGIGLAAAGAVALAPVAAPLLAVAGAIGLATAVAEGTAIYYDPCSSADDMHEFLGEMAGGIVGGGLGYKGGARGARILRGAKYGKLEFTAEGEKFVRVGANPRNLKLTFDGAGGVEPGTYAFPAEAFDEIGMDPGALKDFGDLPGAPPAYFRVLEPPAGTPIRRGIVPGGQYGGRGGVGEVLFPEGT